MENQFKVIVLGSAGGLSEDNLSAYLIAPKHSDYFVSLDAGTLFSGLRKAREVGSLDNIKVPAQSNFNVEGWTLTELVKAYLISNAHLDHITGLTINSTDDSAKNIIGLPETIDFIRDHIFNWKVWPNFADEGIGFHLKKYGFVRLAAEQEQVLEGTEMAVTPYPLSESTNTQSTAFLIRSGDHYALFVGSTGADNERRRANLDRLWDRAAPLIRDGKLTGLFIEVSYPDGVPGDPLFGTLTPQTMVDELKRLAERVNPQDCHSALADCSVVITSIRPLLTRGPTAETQIREQLQRQNTLSARFIVPDQGDLLEI